jgi:hypothetical protein
MRDVRPGFGVHEHVGQGVSPAWRAWASAVHEHVGPGFGVHEHVRQGVSPAWDVGQDVSRA